MGQAVASPPLAAALCVGNVPARRGLSAYFAVPGELSAITTPAVASHTNVVGDAVVAVLFTVLCRLSFLQQWLASSLFRIFCFEVILLK